MESDGFENKGFEMEVVGRKVNENFRYAVRVCNATKNYGKNTVLNNLNMSVREGTIYALLGSSGCGKTTLLSCCVGMRNLNAGQIKIFGFSPGSKEAQVPGNRVGYMPQEIALFKEFTIEEALNYYGKVAGMTQLKINERRDFLVKFLELPTDISRELRNMSGGQQRRLSFAVALIHKPELLILDEPTVGVDPLLRQCIWDHLLEITSSYKTTVIITTHYIEEASRATTLGIMRSGKLLAEDSPLSLKNKYKMSIGETVLQLCLQDSNEDQLISNSNNPGSNIRKSDEIIYSGYTTPGAISRSKTFSNSMNRMSALVKKNLICIWRNRAFFPFLFGLPVLTLCLNCYIIGSSPQNINFGYINNELYECPNNIIYDECIFSNLSCNFLGHLPTKDFNLMEFEREEQAIAAIDARHIWGFLSFPQNFSSSLVEVLISSGVTADKETILQSKLQVRLDMTNQVIAFTIKRNLYDTFQNFTKNMLENCGIGTRAGESPITYLEPIFGENKPEFIEYIAPGVFIALNFFMAMSLTGQILILEKKEGMFERNCVAGISQFESIFAHIISQYGIMLIQTFIGLFIIFVWFEITNNNGQIFLIILLSILQATCGMLFGFTISILCKEERDVLQLTLAFVLPNFLISGILWPIESMPPILQSFGSYWPQTLACESLRSMLSRGWGIEHSVVYAGFIATFIWIFIFIAFIYISIIIKSKSK